MENYRLKNYQKNLKLYTKMNKKIIKFHATEIENYKFYQHKSPTLRDNIDINKIVVPNKALLVKRNWNILLAIKIRKEIRPP